MTDKGSKSLDAVATGRRLTWLRGALGYTARREYAKFLSSRTNEDWSTWEDRLEQYEPGGTMIPISFARLLRQLHQIPYAWLFDEEWAAVPHGLHDALKNYQKNVG